MEISVKSLNDVKVVDLKGNLDTNTTPAAQEYVDKLLQDGATKLLINFEKVDYVSSSGLRLLLGTAKKLKSSGGELRVCTLNKVVQEVFDISGFSGILNVFKSETEAIEKFS